MIRIAIAILLAMTIALPAEARGFKLRLPHQPVQLVDKYPVPIVPGIGHAARNRADCGAAPKRPCATSEPSPILGQSK